MKPDGANGTSKFIEIGGRVHFFLASVSNNSISADSCVSFIPAIRLILFEKNVFKIYSNWNGRKWCMQCELVFFGLFFFCRTTSRERFSWTVFCMVLKTFVLCVFSSQQSAFYLVSFATSNNSSKTQNKCRWKHTTQFVTEVKRIKWEIAFSFVCFVHCQILYKNNAR